MKKKYSKWLGLCTAVLLTVCACILPTAAAPGGGQPAADGPTQVYVGGMPFGVKFYTEGVLVVGFCDIGGGTSGQEACNPAREAGLRVRDVTSGFRACGKEMTNYFADHYAPDYPEPEAILDAVLNGYTVGEAPVIMQERQGGVSSIHSFKSAYYMIKVSLSLIVHRLGSHPKKRRKNA